MPLQEARTLWAPTPGAQARRGLFTDCRMSRTRTPGDCGRAFQLIVTRIGALLLETGGVDAVLTMMADPLARWRPKPVLATRPEGIAQCRRMRTGNAPLLALLEPARLRYKAPKRMRMMAPAHVWALVAPGGLAPDLEEPPRPAKARELSAR